MSRCTVASFDYGPVFKKLLKNRLNRLLPQAAVCGETAHTLVLEVPREGLGALSLALAELLTSDLRPAETARLVSLLPLDLRERQSLLPSALAACPAGKWRAYAAAELADYLEKEGLIVAEGFLRFRLQPVTEEWAAAVDAAAVALLERRERTGLMRLLADVMEREYGAEAGGVRLILHGGGACTLTDESGCRIEGVGAAEPGIMGLLLGLSPESIEVYDLSEGGSGALTDSIKEVFGARARIFVKRC